MDINQVYKQRKNGENKAGLEYIRFDIIMTVIYCYSERKNLSFLEQILNFWMSKVNKLTKVNNFFNISNIL